MLANFVSCTARSILASIVSFRTDEPSSRFARTNHRLVSHGRTIVSFRTDEPSSRFARTNHRLALHGRTIFRTDNHFSSGRPRSLPCLDRDVLCDAIVTHLYQAHVYIIVVDTLLLSDSLSERRRQGMVSDPSTVSKHYRSDGSLTDTAIVLDIVSVSTFPACVDATAPGLVVSSPPVKSLTDGMRRHHSSPPVKSLSDGRPTRRRVFPPPVKSMTDGTQYRLSSHCTYRTLPSLAEDNVSPARGRRWSVLAATNVTVLYKTPPG